MIGNSIVLQQGYGETLHLGCCGDHTLGVHSPDPVPVELSACIKYGEWVDTAITHVGYYFTPSAFYSFAERKEKSTAPSAALLPWII